MSAVINPRKLLARMDVHGSSAMFSGARRSPLVGTAPDALHHAPPAPHMIVDIDDLKMQATWRRVERAMELLRNSAWGSASHIHVRATRRGAAERERDDCDVAASLSFAGSSSTSTQIAQFVYLFRSWDMFADQNEGAMREICFFLFQAIFHSDNAAVWKNRDSIRNRYEDITETVVDEFRHPAHCAACNGYGQEETGPRTGMRCPDCGGRGLVEWSANMRARTLRVRRQDWAPIWSKPYLALFDKLVALERAGAHRHALALST